MFKTDHNLWRTSKGDQYGSSSETGVCWVHWAAFASQAPHVCRAQQLQTASAPHAGVVSLISAFGPKVLVRGDHTIVAVRAAGDGADRCGRCNSRRRGAARWDLISRCPGDMAGNA